MSSTSGTGRIRKGIGTNATPNPPTKTPDKIPTLVEISKARAYLADSEWLLEKDQSDFVQISKVLIAATMSDDRKESIMVIRAIAAIINDFDPSSAANTITEKLTEKLTNNLVESLSNRLIPAISTSTESIQSSATFLEAITKDQAEITSRLKEYANASKNQPTPPTSSSQQPTWAQVASRNRTETVHPSVETLEEMKIHQRQALAARRILVQYNPEDGIPKLANETPESAMRQLRKLCNEALLPTHTDNAKPIVKSISATSPTSLLLEFNTPEAATHIRKPDNFEHLLNILPRSSTIKQQTYTVILRFVPCNTGFNPDNEAQLREVEEDNGLEPNSITSATWIKHPSRRAANQSVANLKITCQTAHAANDLLLNRIQIHDHVVAAHKDIREPMRCNKCQKYNHIHAQCQGAEKCGTCASDKHTTERCDLRNKAQCVSCGPTSKHPSSSKNCPVFITQTATIAKRNPENRMPFFPTAEKWTWAEETPPPFKQNPPTPPASNATTTNTQPPPDRGRQPTVPPFTQPPTHRSSQSQSQTRRYPRQQSQSKHRQQSRPPPPKPTVPPKPRPNQHSTSPP